MPKAIAPRPRNAAATRAAILASARKAFAASGYDGAGVREIAAGAGVTAMLVNRYFGSKEQLFAEVVVDTMANPVILTDATFAAASPAAAFVQGLVNVTKPGATPLDGFLILLRSSSSPRAAEIARAETEKHHQKNMKDRLSGAHTAERAALLLSLVAGVQVMRQMVGLKALAKADPKVLAALLTPVVEQLMAEE